MRPGQNSSCGRKGLTLTLNLTLTLTPTNSNPDPDSLGQTSNCGRKGVTPSWRNGARCCRGYGDEVIR